MANAEVAGNDALAIHQLTHIRLAGLKQAQLMMNGTRLLLATELRGKLLFGISPWVFLHHHARGVADICSSRLLQGHLLLVLGCGKWLNHLSRAHHPLGAS